MSTLSSKRKRTRASLRTARWKIIDLKISQQREKKNKTDFKFKARVCTGIQAVETVKIHY